MAAAGGGPTFVIASLGGVVVFAGLHPQYGYMVQRAKETVGRALPHEIGAPCRDGDRRLLAERQLERARHGHPHVILHIIVRVSAADGPRLQFDTADAYLVPVDQAGRANAGIGFPARLRS